MIWFFWHDFLYVQHKTCACSYKNRSARCSNHFWARSPWSCNRSWKLYRREHKFSQVLYIFLHHRWKLAFLISAILTQLYLLLSCLKKFASQAAEHSFNVLSKLSLPDSAYKGSTCCTIHKMEYSLYRCVSNEHRVTESLKHKFLTSRC